MPLRNSSPARCLSAHHHHKYIKLFLICKLEIKNYICISIEQFSHAIKHLFMKSTIKVGRDHNDKVCIKVSAIGETHSDDLRDETCLKFLSDCFARTVQGTMGVCLVTNYVQSLRPDGSNCYNSNIIPASLIMEDKQAIKDAIAYLQSLL